MVNIYTNFPWAVLNHTLHGTIQHSAELIEVNGRESIGWYSEEGLEVNNKDIRNYLERLSRKCNNDYHIEDVHHNLLDRSDPYLIRIVSKYTEKKLCPVCKSINRPIRTHDAHQFLQVMVLRSIINDFNFIQKCKFCILASCMTHSQY